MNVSHMKNIIVLKDLPSNLVDEAIVILKSGSKIKNKEIVDTKAHQGNFEDMSDGNYETAIKEAEFLVENYMNKIEPRTLPGFMELLPNEQILFEQMKQKKTSVLSK